MIEVDVWSVKLDAGQAGDPSRLPVAERERAARLRSPLTRLRWLGSHLALRRVLAHYLEQDPWRIELRIGSHGKPALADRSAALRFNLSHSGGLALIAVGCRREVGIDVEERKGNRDFLRLAEVGLGVEEAATVRNAPPERRADAFYAAWVHHEAAAKCLGTGLGRPLPETPAISVCDLGGAGEHAAALAIAGQAVPRVCRYALAQT